MILIDLSRDIEHKMAVLPNHPQVVVTPFATHAEVCSAESFGEAEHRRASSSELVTRVEPSQHLRPWRAVPVSIKPRYR